MVVCYDPGVCLAFSYLLCPFGCCVSESVSAQVHVCVISAGAADLSLDPSFTPVHDDVAVVDPVLGPLLCYVFVRGLGSLFLFFW